MTTRKVQNPNEKSGAGFVWAIVAVIVIAAVVIGLIIFNGRTQRSAALAEQIVPVDNLSVTYNEGDNYFTLAAADNSADAKSVDLFEDLSCPHCADLATNTDSDALEKVQAGQLTINVHPMIFLDGQGAQYTPGHSTRALAAELALAAHGEDQALWNLRAQLFENQQSMYNNVDNDDLADRAKDFGAGDEAVQDIRDAKYDDAAQKIGQANFDYQNQNTGQAFTPRVMRDGKDLTEGQDINDWVNIAIA